MNKFIFVSLFLAVLIPVYGHSKGNSIHCGNEPCEEIAEQVFLLPTSQRKVIHHYLIDNDIKIPLFGDISAIGSPITMGKNSFQNVYYYGETESISVSFFDEDFSFDLLQESNKIFLFKNGDISAYFYESGNSKGHPQEPLFEVIIPTTRGDKDRFIKYATKGIPEEEFKALLSKLELNTNR